MRTESVIVSTVASSAKSVQGMKTRSRPPPIFLLCPVGSISFSRWFWASDAGPRYVSSWDPDLLLTLARHLVKSFVFFNMLFLLVFLDLCDRPCRGRWAATVCLRPHGYLLLTAAQRVSFAYLPERGVFFLFFFSFISAWNKIYDISIGCFVSCFQLKLIQSSVFL